MIYFIVRGEVTRMSLIKDIIEEVEKIGCGGITIGVVEDRSC